MLFKTVTFAGLAALGSAHMVIDKFVPYGKDSLNNSPLAADGSDFPCKQRSGVYKSDGAKNVVKPGSEQPLEFKGSAVHGGGSCQISVTTDKEPTKDSTWKVIKSFQGGCPASGVSGNLGNDPSAMAPGHYNYTVPTGMPAGDYTIAWTWFNKIGNREMYMNCGPLTVEGSGGDSGYLNSLPDMFVANIGNGCKTADSTDLEFPDPGSDVATDPGSQVKLAPPTGNCPKGKGGKVSPPKAPSAPKYPGGDSGSAPAPTTSAGAYPGPTKSAGVPGGVFVTAPSSSAAATQPTAAPQPPSTPKQPANGGNGGSGPAPAGGHASGSPCSQEGEWNCVGGSSFQQCASGSWSPVQPMAAGTKCDAGESASLKMMAASVKRAARRAMHFSA